MSHTPPEHLTAEGRAEIERTTWLDFACIILVLVGFFNVIDGLAAIRNSKVLTDRVLFSNMHAWGWFMLVWGAIQIIAGVATYRGKRWGVAIAIVTAFFNAIAQLSWASHNPVWSITILALDVLVIYGLVSSGALRKQHA